MTDAQKAEMLKILDATMRAWIEDDLTDQVAMFQLREAAIRLGLPQIYAVRTPELLYKARPDLRSEGQPSD